MNITEINDNNIETIDINTIVEPKKKRGRPKKTTKKVTEPSSTVDSVDTVEIKQTEKEKLKAELLRLSDYHPEIVTKPVNDKISKLIEEMDIEELRERVRYGHRNQSSKMDNTVAQQTIHLANQLTGRMLGCLDELNETSLQDKLLNECVKDYMCMNILDYIPNELKIGGLYGSHVAKAYYDATLKRPKLPVVTEVDNNELQQKLNDPEFKEKLEKIKHSLKNFSGNNNE
jgi:hypothetical protein